MSKSLKDQLLKAGLVDPKQASAVRKEKQKQAMMARKHKVETVDEAKLNAQRALQEKVERDRQLNRQRDERYVIVSNQLQSSSDDADDPYAEYQIPDDLMW
jgi:uncharacterized protein YaiL (DUF2058 family)